MSAQISPKELEREVRRCFRMLEREGACLIEEKGGGAGVHAPGKSAKASMRIPSAIWDHFKANELVEPMSERSGDGVWRASAIGVAHWRRLCSDDPFRDQHRLVGWRMMTDPDGLVQSYEVDVSASALAWLYHRKGRNGASLISARQFEAGERLELSFRRAALTQRVTFDWSSAATPRSGARGHDPATASDMAMAARQQVRAALDRVGPGLADLLMEVCCYQSGLEAAEKTFGWPQRSGKVVLQIALDRLADHYGLPLESGKR